MCYEKWIIMTRCARRVIHLHFDFRRFNIRRYRIYRICSCILIPNSNQPKFESNFVRCSSWQDSTLNFYRRWIRFSIQHIMCNIMANFVFMQTKWRNWKWFANPNGTHILLHHTPLHTAIQLNLRMQIILVMFNVVYNYSNSKNTECYAKTPVMNSWCDFTTQLLHLRTEHTINAHTNRNQNVESYNLVCSWLVLFAEMILLTKFQLLFYEHHQQMIQPFLFR